MGRSCGATVKPNHCSIEDSSPIDLLLNFLRFYYCCIAIAFFEGFTSCFE
ncbi:hypothetical protein CKA32_002114 [Geitlerinema sp. FC II]|nr:hypothetical protein CKA32_002114 [Geitlerinema sp. FC II]